MINGTCIVTGKTLDPGDVIFTIGGTRYGVKAGVWGRMSPQEQHALREELERGTRQVIETQAAATPDYEAMPFDDLKALAEQRGLNLTGRRSTESVIAALRMGDVRERFAEEPSTESAVDAPESED